MSKSPIPEAAVPFVKELRRLARTGVAAAGFLEQSPLLDLPIVQARCREHAESVSPATIFIEALEWVIRNRLKGDDQRVTLALFGYDQYGALGMGERYERVAKLRNRKEWARYRQEPLDRDLLMVYLALTREGRPALGVTALSSALDRPVNSQPSRQLLDSGGYVTNLHQSFHTFPSAPDQQWEVVQIREITALEDNFKTWKQHGRAWGGRNGKQCITLLTPGVLSITYDEASQHLPNDGRFYVMEVQFPESLPKDKPTQFIIQRQYSVDFERMTRSGYVDQVGLIGVTAPVERAQVAVRFPAGLRPRTLWRVEDLPPWLGAGIPTETNRLELDSSGVVTWTWEDLAVGYSYGIAWEW